MDSLTHPPAPTLADEQVALGLLRERGLRVTPHRLAILAILRANPGHLTADALYQQARARFPGMNLVTLYRNLQWFHEHGLVHPFLLDFEQTRYEYHGEATHHHLVCRQCGTTFDVGDEALDALRASLSAQYGFEAQPTHLAIQGCCARCLA